MNPFGPYRSPWSESSAYIVKTIAHTAIVYSVVHNGQQPGDGLLFGRLRDAKSWLRENGYLASNRGMK